MAASRRRRSGRHGWIALLAMLELSVLACSVVGELGTVHASGHSDASVPFDSGAFAAAYELAQPTDTDQPQRVAAREQLEIALDLPARTAVARHLRERAQSLLDANEGD